MRILNHSQTSSGGLLASLLRAAGLLFLWVNLCLNAYAQDQVPSPQLKPAWDDAAKLLFEDTCIKFEKAIKDYATDPLVLREAQYGLALGLINKQPKTEGNLNRANELFDTVQKTSLDDNMGISSLYYQGRIYEVHRAKISEDKALAIYRDLFTKYPTHPLAQMAYVKYGAISLYQVLPPDEKIKQVLSYEEQGGFLTSPDAQRGFHSLLSQVYTLQKLNPDKTLDHLFALEKVGVSSVDARKDLVVRLAEVSRLQNKKTLAIFYYEKFLNDYSWDSRRYSIQKRLETLKGTEL